MPRPDPVPPRAASNEQAKLAWLRYRQLMRWMGVASLLSAIGAILFLRAIGDEFGLWATIGIALGVGLSILLGTALMGLVFVSHRGGHDDAAARGPGR